MKILFVTTIGSTMGFFKSLVKELKEEGIVVDIATNEIASKVPDCYLEWRCNIFNISTSRSPFSFGNIKAIKEIKNLAMNYDIVHCHTPLAGMATRIGCRKLRKSGLKVIYTAHGFHFFKGAPKKNWLIYYPIERICSKWTDVLITINNEDFEIAKRKMKAKKVEYIPGVGIDVKKYESTIVDKSQKKEEIGIPKESKMILSIGELNENKNHKIVIKALSKLKDSSFFYVIAGEGIKRDYLLKLAENLNVNLKLLGYRDDVNELLKTADLYILPSLREGLNVSVMEALSSKCPTIVSRIRGNIDMIPNEYCFNPIDTGELCSLINSGGYVSDSIASKFDCSTINEMIKDIYSVH